MEHASIENIFLRFVMVGAGMFWTVSFSGCSSPGSETAEQLPAPSRIEIHEAFPSAYVKARNIEIYLPPGYDSTKTYAVCYMHDGQNLFDSKRTFNNVEWGVDEALDSLGYDLIVVGIHNTEFRYQEYMPQKPEAAVQPALEIAWVSDSNRFKTSRGALQSDAYLRFIVEELKPWVDKRYATSPDRDHTFIMGSSMGGLISAYALGEYPGVFGAAGCLSTHLPALDGPFLEYLALGKPSPSLGSRLWMDHGTEGLDSTYAPYQLQADAILLAKGWTRGVDFESRVYENTTHHESDWRTRLPAIFAFLLEGKVVGQESGEGLPAR
ncbi:MAG: hypothetical protein GC205_08340 [Bacteroidetes bacterium]|nr:hypothetical protein [Bacteroidota bacterium]